MPKISRRKFIYLSTGAAIAIGAGATVFLKPKLLAQYICAERSEKFSDALNTKQFFSHELLEYPGLHDYDFMASIDLQNSSDKPIDKLVISWKQLPGFELKSVKVIKLHQNLWEYKIDDIQTIDGIFTIEMPESLEPNEICTLLLSYKPGLDAESIEFYIDAKGQLYNPCWFLRYAAPENEYISIEASTLPTTVTVIPTPKPLKEIYETGQQHWARDIANRKILLQYPVPDDLQRKFWKDPSSDNGRIVIEYFFSELEEVDMPYTELVNELYELPDLESPSYDINFVKSIENIISICLLYNVPKENVQTMLDEGIKEKRKFCTSLQALFWLGKKELWDEDYNPLNPYSSKLLLQKAWNFNDEHWKNFDEVVNRLNFPMAVDLYMFKNFTYYWPRPYFEQSAKTTFKTRKGDCGNQSRFAQYCLKKNGYTAYWLFIKWRPGGSGHVCCLYKDKDDLWYFHDNTLTSFLEKYRGIFGPFNTQEEAIEKFLSHCRQGTGDSIETFETIIKSSPIV